MGIKNREGGFQDESDEIVSYKKPIRHIEPPTDLRSPQDVYLMEREKQLAKQEEMPSNQLPKISIKKQKRANPESRTSFAEKTAIAKEIITQKFGNNQFTAEDFRNEISVKLDPKHSNWKTILFRLISYENFLSFDEASKNYQIKPQDENRP